MILGLVLTLRLVMERVLGPQLVDKGRIRVVIYFVFNVAFCVVIIYLCGHFEESLRHGIPHRSLLLCSCLRVHDASHIDVSMPTVYFFTSAVHRSVVALEGVMHLARY